MKIGSLVVLLTLLVITSRPVRCEQQSPCAKPAQAAELVLPANLIRVPLTRQARDYTCGVSALQSVLAYFGDEVREDELARACKSGKQHGTAYRRIESYGKEHGYRVEIKTQMSLADLKSILDKKQPVICLVQAWPGRAVDYKTDWQDGHYVVAVGYDNDNIFFMDPSTLGHYAYVPTNEFQDRWHDTDGKEKLHQFGMVLSKPETHYDPQRATRMD